MKISHFALPILAQSQDDTSTLLSLKVHTALETGVDHLLDAVGSRNVTQMSSLLQNLVEDTINEGPYELDGDVSAALDVIKRELLGDIRGALNEAHCYAQSELHLQLFCYERCEVTRKKGEKGCGDRCDGMVHKKCRDNLLELYRTHIFECRSLDDIKPYCEPAPKKCCLLGHTTWNCEGLCAGSIKKTEVDNSFGIWLQGQITLFEGYYKQWATQYAICRASYKAYVEKDAECDCEQARCETKNCAWDNCRFDVCEDAYQRCWAQCDAQYDEDHKNTECLEKDRKIDWSATEKIECYVNVLLEKPTAEKLKLECGTEDCYNQYREKMYHKCNAICPEVDFTNEQAELRNHVRRGDIAGEYSGKQTDVLDQATHQHADQDVTAEGEKSVRTKHRAADGNEGGRCTSHLDIDYVEKPCCNPCEERPSRPCEDSEGYVVGDDLYMWIHYHQYGFFSKDTVKDIRPEICRAGEHQLQYAYNLCPCLDCPPNPVPPPQPCKAGRACGAYQEYDYSVHHIKVDCSAISGEVMTYGAGAEVDQ